MRDSNASITSGSMRIQFAPAGQGHGYQLLIDDNGWRPISAPANPLVRGRSFDLIPSQVEQIDANRIDFVGQTQNFTHRGSVRADLHPSWFTFDIELDAPKGFELQMIDGYEPQIMLDLGPLPPYERGDHVWFMTNIANPTKWNDDAFGNDMPATYFFDAYTRAEIAMFFDMTAMSWMSMENTGRFLNYRCGYKRRYQPAPAGALGMYLDGFCGKRFPGGKSRFVYHIAAAPRAETPTDQEAVQLLVERCLPLLPTRSDFPKHATRWSDFSRHCAIDLSDTQHAWGKSDAGEFILNYVDAHSPAWKEAIEARGNMFDMMQPCLESGVWAAHPLSVLRRIAPDPVYDRLQERLHRFIERMVANEKTPLAPPVDDAPRGAWQHVYIVEQLLQVALLNDDAGLVARVRREVDSVIIPLAHKLQYFFPLSFGKKSLIKRGSGNAHSVLGIYASLMLDLHESTGDETYLAESKKALRVLFGLPVNAIHQEVFMTAMAVHAAARLAQVTGEEEFISLGRYFRAQTLRMMHWFNDADTATLGMFQACATISYPAIFENIETLARIAAAIKALGADEPLLRIFDHARRNNFQFFPKCHPDCHAMPLQYIPLENVGILEGPKPTSVGAEIYGAGWVFRAHLLWEAFARCDDREIMVLNLDVFDEKRYVTTGTLDHTFIAFNSTDQSRQATITFPESSEVPPKTVRLGAGQSARIQIKSPSASSFNAPDTASITSN